MPGASLRLLSGPFFPIGLWTCRDLLAHTSLSRKTCTKATRKTSARGKHPTRSTEPFSESTPLRRWQVFKPTAVRLCASSERSPIRPPEVPSARHEGPRPRNLSKHRLDKRESRSMIGEICPKEATFMTYLDSGGFLEQQNAFIYVPLIEFQSTIFSMSLCAPCANA